MRLAPQSTFGGTWHVVEHFAAEALERFGRIDLWINNAGILGPIGRLGSTESDAWTRCFEVNLLGTVNGSRAFLASSPATSATGSTPSKPATTRLRQLRKAKPKESASCPSSSS